MMHWCSFLLGCLVTQTLPAVDHLAYVRGLPITAVHIEAPVGYQTQTLQDVVAISPGQILTDDALRGAIKRLYAVGSFSQVEAQAQREQGTVRLSFILQPQKKLERIDLYQVQQCDEVRLRQALGLSRDEPVTTQTARLLTQRALDELHQQGFFQAAVQTIRRGTQDPDRWSFDMTLREAQPTTIASIQFAPSTGLSPALRQQLLFLQPGDRLDALQINQQQQAIEQAYIRHGFRQAKINMEIQRQQEQAHLRIQVQPGPRMQFRFHGAHVQQPEQLIALWPEPSGAWLTGSLPMWRQKLINHYTLLGYPFIHVELETEQRPQHNEQIIHVRLHEGPAVAITSIRFTNVHALPSSLLVEQIQQLLSQEIPQSSLLAPFDGREYPLFAGSSMPPVPRYAQAPPEQRWVPEIYRQAISQIKAFYIDLGFHHMEISSPQLMPLLQEHEEELHPRCVPDATTSAHLCPHEVIIDIQEGPQWFIHSIGFQGRLHLPTEKLLEVITSTQPTDSPTSSEQSAATLLTLGPGSPYSETALEDGRIALLSQLQEDGYVFAQVRLESQPLHDLPLIDVTYIIEPGEQVVINAIVVQGQVHTQDSVLQQRISLKTNQPYLRQQALETQRNLLRLGVFSNVQIQLLEESRSMQRKDVIIRLQERDRMSINIAPGLSSADGPRLNLTFTHLHLFGTATALSLTGKLNRPLFFQLLDPNPAATMEERFAAYNVEQQISRAIERDIRAEVRLAPWVHVPFEPWARFALIHRRTNQPPFEETRNILNFSLETKWQTRVLCSLESSLEQYFIDGLPDGNNRQSDIPRLEGTSVSARLGPWLRLDWRDHPLHPSQGFWFSARITAALALQQPKATSIEPNPLTTFVPFLRYDATATAYLPLGPLVYAITLRSGLLQVSNAEEGNQQRILAPERFYIGGPDSLRGVAQNTLIAEDSCTPQSLNATCRRILPSERPITEGGTFYGIFKNELRIPLISPLWLSVFYDVGNLWFVWPPKLPLALRMTGGLGLRFVTPVGTVAFEIGLNPWPREDFNERTTQLHFSIGPT